MTVPALVFDRDTPAPVVTGVGAAVGEPEAEAVELAEL